MHIIETSQYKHIVQLLCFYQQWFVWCVFGSFTRYLTPSFIARCMFAHAMRICDSSKKSWLHFPNDTNSCPCILSGTGGDFDCDTGRLGLVPEGRPKGLPYIIHYALAHQAAQAVLRWSHSKRALVISLPLGGQLLEQKTQKLQSIPACSDCSTREGERESDGGLLLAWRTVDSSSRVAV